MSRLLLPDQIPGFLSVSHQNVFTPVPILHYSKGHNTEIIEFYFRELGFFTNRDV